MRKKPIIRECTNCGGAIEGNRLDICPHCGAPNDTWAWSNRAILQGTNKKGWHRWIAPAYRIGWKFGQQVAEKTKHWHKGYPTKKQRKRLTAELRRRRGKKPRYGPGWTWRKADDG